MKRLGMVLLVLLIMIVGAACGKSDNTGSKAGATSGVALADITATFAGVADVVPTGEFQKYTVTLKDASGNAVSVDKVYIFMNMEGMHHPTEGTMHEVEKGVYTLELPLAMPGEWYAEVTLTQGDQDRTLDRFTQQADGKKFMMYMKGYNADTGATGEGSDMNHGDSNMDHGSDTDTGMDHGEEKHETKP